MQARNSRRWLAAGFVLVAAGAGLAGAWALTRPPALHVPAPRGGVAIECPPPPAGLSVAAPLQSAVPAGVGPFRLAVATLEPQAGFSLQARVLSRRDYREDREASLVRTDLALGWGRMREPAVLGRLDISQSRRWYHYRWRGAPPLPPGEIIASSANMHLIPANAAAAREIAAVRAGEEVRIDGWLVDASSPDGWRWRSSTTREDAGQGACELIYACSVRRIATGAGPPAGMGGAGNFAGPPRLLQ